jgi:hypothetical protein
MSLRFSYDTPATMKRHPHGDSGDLRWDSSRRLSADQFIAAHLNDHDRRQSASFGH